MEGRALLFMAVMLAATAHTSGRAVSHEDIKDAIISVVHMFRELTEKLERHEYRERQLGEQLKKALSTLDKRERQQDVLLQRLATELDGIKQRLPAAQVGPKELYSVDTAPLQAWLDGVEGKLTGPPIAERLADLENRIIPRVVTAAQEAERAGEAVRSLEAKLAADVCRSDDTKIITKLDELAARSEYLNGQLESVKSEVNERADLLFGELISGFQHMNTEFKTIAKIEQMMVAAADSIMDTKRRVDYGVHQVVLEIGEVVRSTTSSSESTLTKRLDTLNADLAELQNKALSNLTGGLENQIAQVWRQMGIMYKELSASAGALDSLQKNAEQYANISAATLDGMQGKVGVVAGRMDDVDENLNFLIGRLSLVTHEFNMTKQALSRALDEMRTSIKQVREQATDDRPGPVPISSEADNTLP